jgi:hypothetical protein
VTDPEFRFGYYSIRPFFDKGSRLRLLCSDCAELRHAFGESVEFVEPVYEEDPHKDCADCGAEAVFGQELTL